MRKLNRRRDTSKEKTKAKKIKDTSKEKTNAKIQIKEKDESKMKKKKYTRQVLNK